MNRVAAMLLALFAALSLGACSETKTYRFRMTAEVETPDGLKTGSSVIEVSVERRTRSITPESGGVFRKWKGEAVYVDLGKWPSGKPRALIVALTHQPYGQYTDDEMIERVLSPPGRRLTFEETDKITGRAELVGKNLPVLVTYADLADPMSSRMIQPSELSTAFGTGFSLKRVWIEITKDAVTKGIEQRMPFLVTRREELRRVLFDLPPRFQTSFSKFMKE